MEGARVCRYVIGGTSVKFASRDSPLLLVQPGSRVEVHISNVPKSLFDSRTGPLVIHGLLQHEHKQSVLHFAVQRNTEFQEPIRAKVRTLCLKFQQHILTDHLPIPQDPLVLCVGPRRYRIRPIYSQHVRGGGKGANNVHKSDRFLRHGGAVVATTYGPVIFGKQSCILLKETEDDGENIIEANALLQAYCGCNITVTELVAMGSFLSADPTRIVAKRIILTGHPFKVHRKTATVRYMFFNRGPSV
jgi:pre-rRNA-processing protein TSR1